MKGEIFLKVNKRAVILSIIALVLIGAGYFWLDGIVKETNQQGVVFDDNAKEYTPVDLVNNSEEGIAIPGYSTICFPEGEKRVEITLYNPEKNNCLFGFELYIDGKENPIATTGLVEPGKAVQNVELNEPLQAGNYKLKIKVNTYTIDTKSKLNNAIVYTDLQVLADN